MTYKRALKVIIENQRQEIADLKAENLALSELASRKIQQYKDVEAKVEAAKEIIDEFEAFDPSTAEWLDRLKTVLGEAKQEATKV